MRIGLFGGTFDPVHFGHLLIAEQAREQAGLDEVRFVPSYEPPHKERGRVAAFDRRREMLELALAGQERFSVDAVEKELPAPSYTLHTLRALAKRTPNAEWCLIVGADCLPLMHSWHAPQELLAEAELLVAARPGSELWSAERLAESLNLPTVRMRVIAVPLMEIASHDLRKRVADGRSIRFQVPRAVEAYLRGKNLYR